MQKRMQSMRQSIYRRDEIQLMTRMNQYKKDVEY